MNKTLGNKKLIILFVLPAVLIFTIFLIYPFIPTVYYSLFNYNGIKSKGFVGLSNYIATVNDKVFWHSNLNSFKVILVQFLIASPLSFIFALMINAQSGRIRRFFKTASFFPVVLNVTVICLMWKMLLQPDWGLVDIVLKSIGLEGFIKTWLIDSSTAMWCIAGIFLWQYLGFNMLFFYGGLKAIPNSYYEAAKIEGANSFQQCIRITIPLLQEIIKFVFIITTAGCLSMYSQVQVLTNGGPGDITRTIVYHLYYKAFSLSDFGGSYSISVVYAIECFVILYVINRLVARNRIEYI